MLPIRSASRLQALIKFMKVKNTPLILTQNRGKVHIFLDFLEFRVLKQTSVKLKSRNLSIIPFGILCFQESNPPKRLPTSAKMSRHKNAPTHFSIEISVFSKNPKLFFFRELCHTLNYLNLVSPKYSLNPGYHSPGSPRRSLSTIL